MKLFKSLALTFFLGSDASAVEHLDDLLSIHFDFINSEAVAYKVANTGIRRASHWPDKRVIHAMKNLEKMKKAFKRCGSTNGSYSQISYLSSDVCEASNEIISAFSKWAETHLSDCKNNHKHIERMDKKWSNTYSEVLGCYDAQSEESTQSTTTTTISTTTSTSTSTITTSTTSTTTTATTSTLATASSTSCNLGPDLSPNYGEITAYASTPNQTRNNCDLPLDFYANNGLPTMQFFAALQKNSDKDKAKNDAYEKGANCGRCARVRCSCSQHQFHGACQNGGTDVIVMVTDSCPSCLTLDDIALSNAAWDTVTGNEAPSRYNGTWEFVDCPEMYSSGNLKMRFKVGSSKWWMAVQPYDFIGKISSVQIKHSRTGNTFKNMNFGNIDGFWFQDAPYVTPVEIKITVENIAGITTT